jgi:hypothetical protein
MGRKSLEHFHTIRVEHRFSAWAPAHAAFARAGVEAVQLRFGNETALAAEVTENITSDAKARSHNSAQLCTPGGVLHP